MAVYQTPGRLTAATAGTAALAMVAAASRSVSPHWKYMMIILNRHVDRYQNGTTREEENSSRSDCAEVCSRIISSRPQSTPSPDSGNERQASSKCKRVSSLRKRSGCKQENVYGLKKYV